MIMNISYTFLSSIATQPFACQLQPNGQYYIRASPNVLCYDTDWSKYIILSIIFILVRFFDRVCVCLLCVSSLHSLLIDCVVFVPPQLYMVAFPVFMLHLFITARRKRLTETPHWLNRYGPFSLSLSLCLSLCSLSLCVCCNSCVCVADVLRAAGCLIIPYRQQYWFWELLNVARKFVVVVIFSFGSGPHSGFVQINFALVALFVFLVLQVRPLLSLCCFLRDCVTK